MRITWAHTPDADDAFMFYGLLHGKVDTYDMVIEDCLRPIAELNKEAERSLYDVTALSAVMYPHIMKEYDLMPCGMCVAERRGPVLIVRRDRTLSRIAVPGFSTTAYHVLRMYAPEIDCVVVPFDEIVARVYEGVYDGGILISEDQVRYDTTMCEQIDLGAWWRDNTGYPLPLGIDVMRSSFSQETKGKIVHMLRSSIEYALTHSEEALAYALPFGRAISPTEGRDFIHTFVNGYTCDMGERGKEALQVLWNASERMVVKV